jgi:hypothetical protein
VGFEELADIRIRISAQHGGSGDFVAIQVEDGQHGTVTDRVQELDAFPGAFERSCLRLAVPDHRDSDEIRVIEDGAEGVREDVAEFSTLVHGAGGRNADVARDAARRRELAEEAPQARGVRRDVRIDLGVGPFQVEGIHVRRDDLVSVMYSAELNSATSSILSIPHSLLWGYR